MFFRTSTLFDASMIKAMDQKVQDLSHLTQQMLMMFPADDPDPADVDDVLMQSVRTTVP